MEENKPNINSNAHVRKNATTKKLADVFLAEDVADAKSYIFWDVIVPTIKDGIGLTLHSAVDAIFGVSRGSTYGRTSGGGRTNYTKYSSVGVNSSKRPIETRKEREIYSFDDIIFDDRGLAELILEDLNDQIDEYGTCSVNDYFDVVRKYVNIRIDSDPQDTRYGWTSLRSATVERAGREFYIRFPRAKALN